MLYIIIRKKAFFININVYFSIFYFLDCICDRSLNTCFNILVTFINCTMKKNKIVHSALSSHLFTVSTNGAVFYGYRLQQMHDRILPFYISSFLNTLTVLHKQKLSLSLQLSCSHSHTHHCHIATNKAKTNRNSRLIQSFKSTSSSLSFPE